MGAMESRHVLPAHLRRLADSIHGALSLVRGLRVGLDDLVAALAVNLVGLDVHGEELDLVIAEAVEWLERGQGAGGESRAPQVRAEPGAGGRPPARAGGPLLAPGGHRAGRGEGP